MFVRRKVNKSGSISVHVVDKARGRYRVIKVFGSVESEQEVARLERQARTYIREAGGGVDLFPDEADGSIEDFLSSVSNTQVHVAGPELIFGRLYDRIGFGEIEDEMFRHLVICRLFNPGNKLRLGARPKNESDSIKDRIIALNLKNGDVKILDKGGDRRLAVSKTERREHKDAANTKRGLERLRKRMGAGRLTKTNINNRGYNKYLKMERDVTISIDMEKYEADAVWDGIKAYVTNTGITAEEVISNYGNLWYIERAFRMNKTDLHVRPIYHRLRNRIEGHICICFTAYTILLEMERMLKENGSKLTLDRV